MTGHFLKALVFSVLILIVGISDSPHASLGSEPSDHHAAAPKLTANSGPLNQAQLSYLVCVAATELDSQLPGGAAQMLSKCQEDAQKHATDYATVSLQQLKNAAKPIYDRLTEIGYTDQYPWIDSSPSDDDKALATVQEAKHFFLFDLTDIDSTHDTDGDGLPDWWKWYYFGSWYGMEGTVPDQDWDGDGISNAQEYVNGTGPTDEFNGAPPKLLILEGGDQRDNPGTKLPMPLAVRADDSQYDHVPITFRVTSGGALLLPLGEDNLAHLPTTQVTMPASHQMVELGGGVHLMAWVSIVLPNKSNDTSVIEISATSRAGMMKVKTTAITTNPSLSPPLDFKVAASSQTDVTLTWTSADPVLQTTIEASKDREATWFTLGVVAPGVQSVTVTGSDLEQNPSFRIYTGGDDQPVGGTTVQWPFPSTRAASIRRRDGRLWRQERWRSWNEVRTVGSAPLRKQDTPFIRFALVYSDPLEWSILMDVSVLLTDHSENVSDQIIKSLQVAWKKTTEEQKIGLRTLLANEIVPVLTASEAPHERWANYSSVRGRACRLAGLFNLDAAAPALVELLKPFPDQTNSTGYHKMFDEMTPEGFPLDSPAIGPLIQIGPPAEPALWEALRVHRATMTELMLQYRMMPQQLKREADPLRAESKRGSYVRYILEHIRDQPKTN